MPTAAIAAPRRDGTGPWTWTAGVVPNPSVSAALQPTAAAGYSTAVRLTVTSKTT